MAESFFDFDRSAVVLSKLHEVRGTGIGELCGWRSWEITSRATITVEPQTAVRPKRMIIPGQRGVDWIIHDIRINAANDVRRSYFGAGQGIPGAMFAPQEPDMTLQMDAVGMNMSIEVVVEYVGPNPDGGEFLGMLMCQTVDGPGMVALPINSAGRIFSAARVDELGSGKRIGIQIDDRAWVFRQDRRRTPFEIVIEESPLRREQPTMERMLYIDTDNGKGGTLRSGDPQLVVPAGIRRPVAVPFRAPPATSAPDQPRSEVPDLWAVRPRVLSLHVLEAPKNDSSPFGHLLFGIDETINQVVFEISVGRSGGRSDGLLLGRFDKSGYTPEWWESASAWSAAVSETATPGCA